MTLLCFTGEFLPGDPAGLFVNFIVVEEQKEKTLKVQMLRHNERKNESFSFSMSIRSVFTVELQYNYPSTPNPGMQKKT